MFNGLPRYEPRIGYIEQYTVDGYVRWHANYHIWDVDLCKYVDPDGEILHKVKKRCPVYGKKFNLPETPELKLEARIYYLNVSNNLYEKAFCEIIDSM